MKDEARIWMNYAEENLQAARLLLKQSLYNPCLQNTQQSIEKALKALLLEKAHSHRKTHSITELIHLLTAQGIIINLSEEECDLLDSIYLPSKYPLGGILPDFEPDVSLCLNCVHIAEKTLAQVRRVL